MASFYGVNATKVLVNNPSQKAGVGEVAGVQKTIYDKYTFSAVLATTDVLYMGATIPKGARVLDVIIKSADLGTTGDINVGWLASEELSAGVAVEAADPDGFFAALDVNAAADGYSLIGSTFGNNAGLMKKFNAAVQVVIVPSEITTATSGDIEIAITYVVD